MTAAAYIAGVGTGLALAAIAIAHQSAKRRRDRASVNQHLAMVRAMSAFTPPRRNSTP